jgi:formylglycine-generating enzyme required for sulfatase activity
MTIRIIFILVLALFSGDLSYGQMPALLSKKTLKNLPGVAPVKYDMVFMDEGEITNLDWKEYIYWLSNYDTANMNAMLPDTFAWNRGEVKASLDAFRKYYFRHQAYHDFPVVGINRRQAEAYCQWRAARIMETEWFKKSELDSIIFRLPTRNEWQMAARGKLSNSSMWPWEGESIRFEEPKKLRGLIRLNCKSKYSSNQKGVSPQQLDETFITTPSYSYWPNTFELYNMCGNVAEWTQEGFAVGGSWNNYAEDCKIEAKHAQYTDTFSSKTIGFRCVMEIVQFKKSQGIKSIELNAKIIEKSMAFVPDTNQFWFISYTETPQNWYYTFLKENNIPENLIEHQNWLNAIPYQAMVNYGKIQAFAMYPVVNISYEAAVNYCKWIGTKYNKDPKRKYKKVEFRLPTEEEWLHAAQAGNPAKTLPHAEDQLRNSKGCYLYNFRPHFGNTVNAFYKPSGSEDGSEYPSKVYSYFPNDYGLYNCSGNVSEMLKAKGLCKGGSWLSKGEDIYLKASAQGYEAPRSDLGFRVVMEVLER